MRSFTTAMMAGLFLTGAGAPVLAETTSETLFQHKHWEVELVSYDDGTYACFIVEGQLDVQKDNDGQPVLIAILSRGRSIGEMAVIDESLRSASVVARSNGKMLLLHRDRFAELIDAQPRIGVLLLLRIARMMSLSLRKTSAAVAELLA